MMICLRILTCLSTGEPMAGWRIVIRKPSTEFMELLQYGLKQNTKYRILHILHISSTHEVPDQICCVLGKRKGCFLPQVQLFYRISKYPTKSIVKSSMQKQKDTTNQIFNIRQEEQPIGFKIFIILSSLSGWNSPNIHKGSDTEQRQEHRK